MINALSHVNWLAVLAASVAQFILGGIWFAGLVGKPYAAALGIAGQPQPKPGLALLAGPFLCGMATVTTTAMLLRALGIAEFADALALGALAGLGYLVPMTVNIAINPVFPRPFYYSLLNAPFFLAASLVSCAILVTLP